MKYLIIILFLIGGCANARTVGNNEMHLMEPSKCNGIGVIKRDGACYRRVIISAKNDAHVIITKPDGTIYDIDNVGGVSFAHDLAATVQAVVLQKAITDE